MAAILAGTYDHEVIDASHCGLAGNTTTVADAASGVDSYYLVAGYRNGSDGPLGGDRPPASPECP